MKRFSLFILSLMMCCAGFAQDIEVKCHIVDAETLEPLPFVQVYGGDKVGTLSNYDGDITITVDANTMLRFSCVGYEKMSLQASKVPATLKLKALTSTMKEITVLSWENILDQVGKKMNKEFKRNKNKKSQYFCRMNTKFRTHEVTEAFVEARSASNLRDITVLKGKHERKKDDKITGIMIADMNFHHPYEVGVLTREAPFWRYLTTPIPENQKNKHYYSNRYTIKGEELAEADGKLIYRINFQQKDTLKRRAILTGTLYVDASTLHPLRFDGEVENTWIDITQGLINKSVPIGIKLHIDYRHDKGFAEVEDISTLITSGDLRSQSVLFNVDDMNLGIKTRKNKNNRQENLLASIGNAGYDSQLWASSHIIQRTEEEELLIAYPDSLRQTEGMAWSIGFGQTDEEKEALKTLARKADGALMPYVERLTNFGQSIPQEKVYLHMDNTCYFKGDTIWFAAYTRQTNDGYPSRLSGVLYVELYNQDGYLMERKLIQMKEGRGYGNFELKKDYYGGFYELRAYTRWQLNWGRYQHWSSPVSKDWFISKEMHDNYFRDYDKLYSRVFPVYDAPQKEGDYVENMTARPLLRYFKKDPDKRELTLSLYPEGGNLVNGLPCRVAYEATWSDGEKADLQDREARGTFIVTPGPDSNRKIEFLTKKGEKVSAKLPKAEDVGVALQAFQTDSTWNFDIRLSKGLCPDTLGVTIMHEGILNNVYALDSLHQVISVPKRKMSEGVNQITVFSACGQVWADRLFFNTKNSVLPTPRQKLKVQADKDFYEPYEQISLDIQSKIPYATLSLAVRDAAHIDGLYDNATMRTEMLLASEVKGFIPNPKYYFEKDDDEHRNALDLLMMIQGWRRFNWTHMAVPHTWEIAYNAESTPIITGSVYNNPGWVGENLTDPEFASKAATHGYYFVNSMSEEKRLNEWLAYFNGDGDAQNLLNDENDPIVTDGYDNMASDAFDPKVKELSNMNEKDAYRSSKKGKKNVLVHAELVSTDGKEARVSTLSTHVGGKFRINMPKFYEDAVFFLTASDSAKWKKKETIDNHVWIQQMSETGNKSADGSEFAIRIHQPYPRFVKPYNYYQQHLLETSDSLLGSLLLADGTVQMKEVKVGAKHSGLKRFSDSIPAIKIDAYQAYNDALDAGLYDVLPEDIVRSIVGDYGMEFPFVKYADGSSWHSNIEVRLGQEYGRRVLKGLTLDRDSSYMNNQLSSYKLFDARSGLVANYNPTDIVDCYSHQRLDKYIIYTDYQPRLTGSNRYYGGNLPNTQIALYPYPDGSSRVFYRDRRYIIKGFAYPDEFYQPNYQNRKLDEAPKDYRRTLYWNPALKLDGNGNARVTLYNNGKNGQINISAEGMVKNGEILE